MSLFNTIAHPGTATARRLSIVGVGIAAVGLMLGVVGGLLIPSTSPSTDMADAAQVSRTGLAHDEFLRLNTTDLDHLSPTVPARVVESQTVDPFLYWNITALDGLVPPASDGDNADMVTEQFLEWNITSLEYPISSYTQPSNGPR